MKKVLVLCAALALYATSAFAVGADLSFNACPGGAGAATDATIDCAGGGALVMYATFQPAEAIVDLVGIDAILDLTVTGGDLNSSANFWDFATVNATGLGFSRVRPATICNAYTAAWTPSGSGEGGAALIRTPTSLRIAASSYRPSDLSVTANQKIYGFGLTIDGTTSTQGGGATNGCPLAVVIALNSVNPGSSSGAAVTSLTGPSSNATPCNHINGDATACQVVPTARHTWGQLKSLYR